MLRPLFLALLVLLAACDRRRPTTGGSAALATNLAADPGGARVLLGAPDDPVLGPLLARLAPGVRIDGPEWVIGEGRWARRGALLVAVFPPRSPPQMAFGF